MNKLMFVAQGIGALFLGFFLAAYFAGLPSTKVYHSEPIFRIPLFIFGVLFLILVLFVFILNFFKK